MIGCKDWMREPPVGSSEGPVMPELNALSDVVDNTSNREYQGFLEVLPEAHPLKEAGFLIEGVIEALCTQQ